MTEEERMIFEKGDENCKHEWKTGEKRWEESVILNGKKKGSISYYATTKICKLCEREESLGGSIIEPYIPGYCDGAEYVLEPDGSKGMFIS